MLKKIGAIPEGVKIPIEFEDALEQGGHRHQGEEGEHDLRQEGHLVVVIGGKEENDPGRQGHAEGHDNADEEYEYRESRGEEVLRLLFVFACEIAGKGRDEGRGHRALGEEPPRKFGRVKATAKASASQPVPIKAALVISRTRPRTREAMVSRDSLPPSRIIRPVDDSRTWVG